LGLSAQLVGEVSHCPVTRPKVERSLAKSTIGHFVSPTRPRRGQRAWRQAKEVSEEVRHFGPCRGVGQEEQDVSWWVLKNESVRIRSLRASDLHSSFDVSGTRTSSRTIWMRSGSLLEDQPNRSGWSRGKDILMDTEPAPFQQIAKQAVNCDYCFRQTWNQPGQNRYCPAPLDRSGLWSCDSKNCGDNDQSGRRVGPLTPLSMNIAEPLFNSFGMGRLRFVRFSMSNGPTSTTSGEAGSSHS